MKKFGFLFLITLLPFTLLEAQIPHQDFIGAGHTNGVSVTASSSQSESQKTVDGFPIQNEDQLKDAARFLAQCTFGGDMATIQMTAAMGKEAWLDEQFSLPYQTLTATMQQHYLRYWDEPDPIIDAGIWSIFTRSAWMQNNLTAPDLLRQRMAFILSQIMVINTNSDFFEDFATISTRYYDLLGDNAFKNYRGLLGDVAYSPAMGVFLSHFNNPKADPVKNTRPDENFAREIMQLFSIGLWELDEFGNRKRDTNGQFIPTYTNADIKEFAQVFTGLGSGLADGEFGTTIDNIEQVNATFSTPMKMFQNFHDTSEKQLLKGVVLPAGQTGDQDISQTLDHLSSHSNTGPFIAKSLIRFMTTSNPSGAYVKRVADVFNASEANNFQKVIKAILLDPEARLCQQTENYTFGKLKEPLVRHMNLLRAFPITPNENGDFDYETQCLMAQLGQSPLEAPSVFNFFVPEYSPQGLINQQYRIAPEFQILNATNAISFINEADVIATQRRPLLTCMVDEPVLPEHVSRFPVDYSSIEQIAGNSTNLINHLDILLANGALKDDTKTIIKNAVDQLSSPADRVKMALYLVMVSPDYAILK